MAEPDRERLLRDPERDFTLPERLRDFRWLAALVLEPDRDRLFERPLCFTGELFESRLPLRDFDFRDPERDLDLEGRDLTESPDTDLGECGDLGFPLSDSTEHERTVFSGDESSSFVSIYCVLQTRICVLINSNIIFH